MRQILSPQLTLLPIMISLMGCSAITPFHRTQLPDVIQQHGNGQPTEFVIGEPDPVLQRLAYVVETPVRVLPLGPKHIRHKSSATTTEITSYLEQHDLSDVYVCVNEYDPVAEWRRLPLIRTCDRPLVNDPPNSKCFHWTPEHISCLKSQPCPASE